MQSIRQARDKNSKLRRKETFFLTFFFFLLVSLLVFFISNTPFGKNIQGVLEVITKPGQYGVSSLFYSIGEIFTNKDLDKLKEENTSLRKNLVDLQILKNENSALKDQFATTFLRSTNLLPATIIGNPGFIPGVSLPTHFILDKGENDNVRVGQAVVVKNNVVGKISNTSKHMSQVLLITDSRSSFAAVSGNALGVIKGQNDEIIFENVLLSDTLSNADTIVTKGDVEVEGLGYPPGLIVGKIKSIDKKPSSIFQSAKVKSLIDFQRLTTVFVLLQ